ncbi:hypothetical protein Q3G72_028357 [Acer saccharum]|nr:hypothetical protein Q3G72_028357 [Acer saccharum]
MEAILDITRQIESQNGQDVSNGISSLLNDDNNSLEEERQFVNVNEIHDRASDYEGDGETSMMEKADGFDLFIENASDCEGDRETSIIEKADGDSVVYKAETVVATVVESVIEKIDGKSVVEKVETVVATVVESVVEKDNGVSVVEKVRTAVKSVVEKAEGESVVEGETVVQKAKDDGESNDDAVW